MDKSELNLIKSDESNNMDKEIEKIRNINYKIQVDRVLYIFKRLIKKLEIMVNTFLKNRCIINEITSI